MPMPGDIAAKFIGWPKLPYAFVRDFIVVLICPIPGSVERICCGLELLMRNQVDSTVSVDIMIGAAGNPAQTQVRTGIGLGCINGVLGHKVMIGEQNVSISAAKYVATHFL